MLVRVKTFLFDTNALIYWVNTASPYRNEVSQLIQCVLKSNHSIYALNSSLSDVYYALHTHYTNEENARAALFDIVETFDLIELSGPFVLEAINSNEPDYEDGLIRAAAEALAVDAIITYDKKAFRNSPIPKLTAQEAVEELSQ